MTIQTKHYNGLIERDTICKEYEALNKTTGSTWRPQTDNFDDPNWKHGDPIIGTMTFTNVMPPTIMPEPIRDLAAELDELKVKVAELDSKIK